MILPATPAVNHLCNDHFARNALRTSSRNAFTLIELLVVIMIILLIAGLGVGAFRGGAGSDGVRDAASVASGYFSLARNEAIMRRTSSVVVIDGYYDAAQPDNYLRRMAVAYQGTNASGATWIQSAKWTRLPGHAFVNAAFAGNLTNSLPGAFSNACYIYPFDFKGCTTNGVGKFVLSLGSTAGGVFQEHNAPKTRYGFMVFPMGHMSFYKDPTDIQ